MRRYGEDLNMPKPKQPRVLKDIFGNQIELTEERWHHIIAQHPEITRYLDEIAQTLAQPILIKESRRDELVWLYYRYFGAIYDGKYILVVVKVNKRKFVLTAFITDYIREGEIIWRTKD